MTTPQDIWNALLANGASSTQAAGIMGNMFYESSLNPEAAGVDSNGYTSYGLIQWNSAPGNYPNASSLVTGNPAKDLVAQIRFLAQTGGFKAASGSTATEAGSNFAANYERCSSCQSGGAQNSSRSAKAAEFYTSAQSGNWQQSAGSGTNASTAAVESTGYDSNTCLIGSQGASLGPVHLSSGSCYFSNTQARALIGGMLLGVGTVFFLAGAVILVAFAFRKTDAGSAVSNSVSAVRPFVPKKRGKSKSNKKSESEDEDKDEE